MRERTRGRARRTRGLLQTSTVLLCLNGVLVVVYFVGTVADGDSTNVFVDVWVAALTQWVPAAVFVVAVIRTSFKRWDVLFAAAAVTFSASADVYYSLSMDGNGYLPFPSVADAGYLLFYPLMMAALVALVRHQLRGLAWPVVLDSAVASFGAAAVLAAFLSPVLEYSLQRPASLGTAVAVAYPLFDLVLVAVIAGIAASPALDIGPRWTSLALGLAIFAAADVVYALQEYNGTHNVGTPLDVAWALGLAFIALWGDGIARPARYFGRSDKDPRALAVPAFAVAAGLGVLILGTQTAVSDLSLILASVTVALAALPLMFRQRVLHRESRTDELTGLPNRRAFNADATPRLTAVEGAAPAQKRSALMLLDLDRFKEVNDSLGHDAGDRLLIQVGARLLQSLQPNDLLARVGGDEFAILIEGAGEPEAIVVAEQIRAALREPFTIENIPLHITLSIGIATFPAHGGNLGELLRRADMAMYKAKAARSGHHLFEQADDDHGEVRLRTLEDLRVAIAEDQFVVHYQPKVDFATGDVVGVEALVRWNHPTRGLLMPEEFIALVDEAGLMDAVTLIVLGQALDQAAIWDAAGRPLTVAVNVSPSSLTDDGLPERVVALVAARAIPSFLLTLEVTEEYLISDRDTARRILTSLRAAGIGIAVDDFGTGYSSLSFLRDFPVDELKLDRSFVTPMVGDSRAGALVKSTINLAHSLGLRMVAEGVENQASYDQLARYGCDHAQGFLISRAISATELDDWLVARRVETEGRVR